MNHKPQHHTIRAATGDAGPASHGLSIIDSLMAFVIVIVAVLAFVGIVPVSMIAVNQGAAQLQAVGVAEQYIEAIRHDVAAGGNASLPAPPSVAVDPGESILGTGIAAVSPGDFTTSNNGCPLAAGSTLRYDCKVTVGWTQADATRSVSLETYVTHQ